MYVLDYIRHTDNDTIIIPSFHTGHLGFMPGTPVNIYLLASSNQTSYEVLVTPLPLNQDNLMQLTCVMKDRPGVVQNLVEAVARLGINVVNEESSAINHLNQHKVHMLLDWSTSKFRDHKSSRSASWYKDYACILPLPEERYVKLFEHIVARCADVMIFDETQGTKKMPQLRMRPLECYPCLKQGNAIVEPENQLRVKIRIPADILGLIHINYIRFPSTNKRLTYILMSETQERRLRIFFPNPEIVSKLVHIAFEQNDVPGALAAVLKVVALAQFNILQGLGRKHSDPRNSWEAILEYRGTDPVPENEDQLREWVAQEVLTACRKLQPEELRKLRQYDIHIRPPAYPKRPRKGQIILNESLETAAKED